MKKTIQFFIFLILNFACLALSNYLMGEGGPTGQWYKALPRAPWTPPGWVFGATWSLIMVCFAIYLTVLKDKNLKDYIHYGVILFLCAFWNAVFFQWHMITAALVLIFILALSVYAMTWRNHSKQGKFSLLMLPFCLWITIANTLNAYPVFM